MTKRLDPADYHDDPAKAVALLNEVRMRGRPSSGLQT